MTKYLRQNIFSAIVFDLMDRDNNQLMTQNNGFIQFRMKGEFHVAAQGIPHSYLDGIQLASCVINLIFSMYLVICCIYSYTTVILGINKNVVINLFFVPASAPLTGIKT